MAIQDAAARSHSPVEDAYEFPPNNYKTKRKELLLASVLFSMICLGSVAIVLIGGNPLFWAPIALGSLGVAGSSVIYLDSSKRSIQKLRNDLDLLGQMWP